MPSNPATRGELLECLDAGGYIAVRRRNGPDLIHDLDRCHHFDSVRVLYRKGSADGRLGGGKARQKYLHFGRGHAGIEGAAMGMRFKLASCWRAPEPGGRGQRIRGPSRHPAASS